VRFVTDLNQPVSVYMTPKERLVTVREGEAREVVLAKMHEKRVRKGAALVGLVLMSPVIAQPVMVESGRVHLRGQLVNGGCAVAT
ncbi:hypothetical protein MJI37_32080, partial [Salmonella enterica subsp. enterica serovar Cerro]|nr:hypothetical protein [Salmonella enterica subsp. enterica serovar Cerro]